MLFRSLIANRNGGQLSELDGTEWLYPPGAPSTGRAQKGALQKIGRASCRERVFFPSLFPWERSNI